MDLTDTQREILAFLAERIEADGFAPSQSEISRAFGFKGVRGAQYHLEALEAAGAIERRPGQARSLRVLTPPPSAQAGLPLEPTLPDNALQLPVLALRLQQDWLGPPASLAWLLGKLGPGARRVETISRDDLDGAPADHFGWMKTPAPVASRIADWLGEADATFVARGDTAA